MRENIGNLGKYRASSIKWDNIGNVGLLTGVKCFPAKVH